MGFRGLVRGLEGAVDFDEAEAAVFVGVVVEIATRDGVDVCFAFGGGAGGG